MIPTAEQLDEWFKAGAMKRLGMGSRRACYAIPDTNLCVKCYRSDAEIAEGKHPGRRPVKPIAAAVVREISRYRFDEKRNTCCQEFRYWCSLRKRLPSDLLEVFPTTMSLLLVPSRGWCVVEDLITDPDGSSSLTVHDLLLRPSFSGQDKVESALCSLAERFASESVRFYDPNNVMVQRTSDGFRLRLADFEPASHNLIPIDRLFPFIVKLKVRRRVRRFLSFASDYRNHSFHGSVSDDPNAARRDVFAVRNKAGRLLVAWTDAFPKLDPELAAKVVPVPLDTPARYREDPSRKEIRKLVNAARAGECAWIFYPSKCDDVRTVFFVKDDRLFVKKVVLERRRRIGAQRFVQRELPPVPIYKGESVADRLRPLAIAKDYSGVERELVAFFDELLRIYPPIGDGILPDCAFDAIPQNCIVDSEGRYNFFDLEYDMVGGVPLSYLIFRSVCTTVVQAVRGKRLGYDYWRSVRDVASHYGVEVKEDECLKINAAVKRFNTTGMRRLLTNIWLSLIPVRAWRLRFCWWSTLPDVKGAVK